MNWLEQDNFTSKIDKSGDCWIWLGGRGGTESHPYGRFSYRSSGTLYHALSHRLAYEAVHGAIPKGLVIDHLCRNTLCCNPAHLEAKTQRENVMMYQALITHCPQGHGYTPDNTHAKSTKYGGVNRVCRACARAYATRKRQERVCA